VGVNRGWFTGQHNNPSCASLQARASSRKLAQARASSGSALTRQADDIMEFLCTTYPQSLLLATGFRYCSVQPWEDSSSNSHLSTRKPHTPQTATYIATMCRLPPRSRGTRGWAGRSLATLGAASPREALGAARLTHTTNATLIRHHLAMHARHACLPSTPHAQYTACGDICGGTMTRHAL
jgi:hypothetical protein